MTKERAPGGRVYFPGLHGLRFFAAMLVVVSHIELMKDYHGYPSHQSNPAVYELGRIAVTFFFVLSGFLITYLLLAEKQVAGVISVRKFYVRRMLRIWPLYYLAILLAFVILPQFHLFDIPRLSEAAPAYAGRTLPLFLLLLPQLALTLFPPVPYAEPLWSIGVEEQFYLLWPLLVARVKRFLPLVFGIVVAGILAKQLAIAYASHLHDPDELRFWNHFIDYFYFTRIECMGIGAIGAWLVFHRKKTVLNALYSRVTQLIVYALAVYLVLTPRHKPLLHYSPISVLFCIIVLNIAANPRSLVKVENPLFTFLGNISYAIYMFHEIAIKLVMEAQTRISGTHFTDLPSNAILYAGSATLTLLIATAAWRYYELWFLRLNTRFTIVRSGAEVGALPP
ncbi:MAG: acyltransferase family protein [Thermoanaerobaculia bacterium]